MPGSPEDIQRIIDRETRAWDARDADLLVSVFHPDMVWPWPPSSKNHDPVEWVLDQGRFDEQRWREGWSGLFAAFDLIHNRRKTVRIEMSAQGDGAFAVVDIDTLWRNRQSGAPMHWQGRTCKIYTLLPPPAGWKMIAQVGVLDYALVAGSREAARPSAEPKEPGRLSSEVNALGRVKYRIAHGSGTHVVPVLGITPAEIIIVIEPAIASLAPGAVIPGALILEDREHAAPVNIKSIDENRATCVFTEEALRHIVEGWIGHEAAAIKLAEVSPSSLQAVADGTPHFYRSGLGCEVFFVEKDGELSRFEMTFFGYFVEGDSERPLRCGVLDEDRRTGAGIPGSTFVRYMPKTQEEILALGRRFVAAAWSLKRHHRELLERALQHREELIELKKLL